MSHDRAGVRVRFAPSPTGHLHVGNTRTALTNHLFARKEGGVFVLRIEDTDLERSDAAYEAAILEDLKWLNIGWDEGPFRQSERTELYRAYAGILLDKGRAYKCFCSKERLEEMRESCLAKGIPPRYDGACRSLAPEALESLEKEGRPYVVRFRPLRKAIRVKDRIHGEIVFPEDHVDDFIILKQELTPSYNFAVTIDDMLMGITHVIRGADHVSNTPKQIMLFQAFDRQPPEYAHHSLLTGSDQKPLSKRHGATHVREFRDMGVLSQALINYIGIMGRKVGKELMDEVELVDTFSLESLSASDSLFDVEKLFWFNKEYMRRMPVEKLLQELGLPDEYMDKVLLLRENAKTLAEIKDLLHIFDGAEVMEEGISYFADLGEPDRITKSAQKCIEDPNLSFEQIVKEVKEATDLQKKEVFMVLRILLTGRLHGPPLKEIFPLLGKETIVRRLSWLKQRLSLS
jgi:nondiscriminating glutamyl-tRNA synthetase